MLRYLLFICNGLRSLVCLAVCGCICACKDCCVILLMMARLVGCYMQPLNLEAWLSVVAYVHVRIAV